MNRSMIMVALLGLIGSGFSQPVVGQGIPEAVLLINNDGNDRNLTVGLGESSPIMIGLMYGFDIAGVEFTCEIVSSDSLAPGVATLDSVIFAGPLGVPDILPERVVTYYADGILPDTVSVALSATQPDNFLSAFGRYGYLRQIRQLAWVFLGGVGPGYVEVNVLDLAIREAHEGGLAGSTNWADPIQVFEGGGILLYDAGVRDTLSLNASDLFVGQSMPIGIRLTNDKPIQHLALILDFLSADASVQYDSIVYLNRLDPFDVCSVRHASDRAAVDGGSGQMRIQCYAAHLEPFGYPLPIGDDALCEIWVTGLAPGALVIDTASIRLSTILWYASTTLKTIDREVFCPVFQPVTIDVVDAAPIIFTSPAGDPDLLTAGETVSFEVAAETDPAGGSLQIELASLVGYDDDSRVPLADPQFDPGTGLFSWTPGPADIGIWQASFRATDVSSGRWATKHVRIVVVSDHSYAIPFRIVGDSVGEDQSLATDIIHGDFDGDAYQEIVFAPFYDEPDQDPQSIRVYEYDGFDSFQETAAAGFGFGGFNRGMIANFLDDDQNLDIAMMIFYDLYVLQGNGDNTFSAGVPAMIQTIDMLPPTMSNFNNDAYLDYLKIGHTDADGAKLHVYLGTDGSHFSEGPVLDIGPDPAFHNEATVFGVNSDDFDGDGWDDLAVSTKDGLEIYLNDHGGGYTVAHQYPLDYPPVDIVITNQGTDFNNDGNFDLLLTVPTDNYPWYADETRVMVFYGNGDGSFIGSDINEVRGLCWASRGGDFNDDGHLDIVYANYGEEYVGILFNEGDGSFADEIRIDVPHIKPNRLDCVDIDTDGDFDIIVTGERRGDQEGDYEHWRYLFVNESNPAGVVQSALRITVTDDAALEMVAPNGGRLSDIAKAIPSGEYYRCRLNDNDLLDAVATATVFDPGRYDLVVRPKYGGATEGTFSLEYQLDDAMYRIARNLPVPSDSYVFPIFPGGNSSVHPLQGECIVESHPLFEWDTIAIPGYDAQSSLPITDIECEFRIARDIDFEDVVETATVTGGSYVLTTDIAATDTTAYFWQVRVEGSTNWTAVYVFHVVSSITSIDDEDAGDAVIPMAFSLAQNYPNPFNPLTEIAYSLPAVTEVRLDIYNILGRRVATLVDEIQDPGHYIVSWDADEFASGIYFYRLAAGDFVQTRKMILLK